MPFDPNTPRSRDEVLLQAIVSGDSSAMGDPRDREEEFVKAIADKETLPDYSEASEGDTLQIGADGPEWGPVDALPDYSGASAGDALIIGNDGPEWGAVGKQLYVHYIRAVEGGLAVCYATIITDNSTPFTKSSLASYLDATSRKEITATGYARSNTSSPFCPIFGLAKNSTGPFIDASYLEMSIDTSGGVPILSSTDKKVMLSGLSDDVKVL